MYRYCTIHVKYYQQCNQFSSLVHHNTHIHLTCTHTPHSNSSLQNILHPSCTILVMMASYLKPLCLGESGLKFTITIWSTLTVAPSTSTTYRAGIQRYLSFCQTHGHTPLPGSQHTVTLLATHLCRTLQANTIEVYVAAVSHLHLTQGLSSPTSNNPMLSLAIRGIQRSQDPAHLRPR